MKKSSQSSSLSKKPSLCVPPTCLRRSSRSMSMQSRRKEKSANQLLSRVSKPIPITSASTKPVPQKPKPAQPPSESVESHFQQFHQRHTQQALQTPPQSHHQPSQSSPSSKSSQKQWKPQQKQPQPPKPKHTPTTSLYDELFHDDALDQPISVADNHFSNSWAPGSSNPLLSDNLQQPKLNFHNIFQSKTPLSQPTPPLSLDPSSSPSPTAFSSFERPKLPPSHKPPKPLPQQPVGPATSIFDTIKQQKQQMDPTFNPITSLREEFNLISPKKYSDPTKIPHHGGPEMGSEYPQGDVFFDDDSDLNSDKNSENSSGEVSDYDGYMQVAKERAADDTAFVRELSQYYKQFPHHKKLLQNQKFANALKTHSTDPELEDMTDYEGLGNMVMGDRAESGSGDLFKPIGIEQTLDSRKSPKSLSKHSPLSAGEGISDDIDDIDRDAAKLLEDNTIEVDGLRIPLRGLSRSQVEDFLQQEAEKNTESEEEEEGVKEHIQSLGFTPEELDANRPKRLDYYKLPTHDQIPLIDTNSLEFKQINSVLHWDVPWPEHTSTCDLSVRTCVLGTPNAGKSVIVNNLTRSRVTAVSAKRNTTRRRVLGISTEGNAQLTLYDTPGINEIHDAKRFQRDLATEAWDTVGDADLALVVLDAAKRIGGPELFLLHKCSDVKSNNPHLRWVLVLNKVDLVDPKDRLLDVLYRVQTLMPFDDCFMVSGLDGDGMADLEHYLYSKAVPREWEHASDEKTDQSDIQLATELIRETLYHRLNKEIPYTVQQENVEWAPLAKGQLRIDQRLVVRREQHKRILVGSNGNALKNIQRAAEERLSVAFRRPVSLHLRVSVSVTQDFEGAV